MALPLWQTMKQKHSQNVMAIIFSSGCYAPYIYTIIATPLHFLRLPLSLIFCFIIALGPSTQSSTAESRSLVARELWHWLPRPDSVPYNGTCKCLARQIEVIMRVRVRLCKNVCVSCRMCESWQLCQQGILQLTINQIQVSHSVSVLRTGETPLFGLK